MFGLGTKPKEGEPQKDKRLEREAKRVAKRVHAIERERKRQAKRAGRLVKLKRQTEAAEAEAKRNKAVFEKRTYRQKALESHPLLEFVFHQPKRHVSSHHNKRRRGRFL